MSRTDDSRYHAGGPQDEVAALLSLSLGARLRAGSFTREFGLGAQDDPRGRPIHPAWATTPVLPPFEGEPRLPAVVGSHTIEPGFFASFHRLGVEDAVALVRAARSYQNAIWIAEAEPNLAWLMLVSALETAAVRWREAAGEPSAVLREVKPEWAAKLDAAGGESLTNEMAAELVPLLGATRRFLDFMAAFPAPVPTARPPEGFRRDWGPSAMRRVLKLVYAYRSRALHAGTPFPAPMSIAPFMHHEWHAPSETQPGIAASMHGGVWKRDDYPILLHGFEYVVRNTLLSWWRSLPLEHFRAPDGPPA